MKIKVKIYTNYQIIDVEKNNIKDAEQEAVEILEQNRFNAEWIDSDQHQIQCEDCEELYATCEGRHYKYEPKIWLCDSCHDQRLEK